MLFEKVVFVRYFPLTKAIYTDMYMEELIANKIQVNYLDITELFYPDRVDITPYDFDGTVKIKSYQQLKSYLSNQNNKKTLYVSIMTFERTVFKLFRIFTQFDLKISVFARGVFPNGTTDAKSEITRILKVFSPQRVALFLANKGTYLAKKIGFIKPYDYIFQAGEYGYYGLGLGSEIDKKNAEIVDLNTVDYDKYLVHKMLPASETDNIVFLDQYLPYHPDAKFLNIKTVAPEPYYKELNAFFDKLESITGKRVVIAGHPKAELYKQFNPFNNREIFINQTNDLVKMASMILTHASTAVCFPICYNKKIVLLTSAYMDDILPQFTATAKAIVEASGATLIWMDKTDGLDLSNKIDLDKYEDFKYKYLTSHKSRDKQSKDIFLSFLTN